MPKGRGSRALSRRRVARLASAAARSYAPAASAIRGSCRTRRPSGMALAREPYDVCRRVAVFDQQVPPVRREASTAETLLGCNRPFQLPRPEFLPGRIPQEEVAVITDHDELAAVRGIVDRTDPLVEPKRRSLGRLVGPQVPEANDAVIAAGNKSSRVGSKRHGMDGSVARRRSFVGIEHELALRRFGIGD